MPKIKIKQPKNFSFSQCLFFLDRGFDECLHLIERQSVTKAVRFGDQKVAFNVSESESDLVVHVPDVENKMLLKQVEAYVESWFDMKRNISPFYLLSASDQVMSNLIKSFNGLRLMGIEDLFEALCWAIIGQQINLTFAYKLKRRLTEAYGEVVLTSGTKLYLFPNPSTLASKIPVDLTSMQFSRQKADYIITLAQHFVKSDLSKQDFSGATMEECIHQLVQLRGIGKWTAQYVAMKCLKYPDAFPIQDVGLQNALKILKDMDRKPTLEEINQFASHWNGWKSYATIYLWRSLINDSKNP